MTSHSLARDAYSRPDAPLRPARTVEYDLFARVTRRLTLAFRARAADFPAFAVALHDNDRLWRTLALDVADPGNALPAALRSRLFYLHEFTTLQTRRILQEGASAEVLIDINTAIMRGLRGDAGSGPGGGE
ncbi:flagellar biosynthesis regulator FlaF [Szabonella alba]|uniref:Flagellar biosynthesis regulator FlaF n=1 Tax=Szabonella alba TaxID=2804194 RepID=A0A8K0VC27_9RHOB|nr:flagellar biosynthesis regulator FlaF [Szabonella alba]MBL4917009.1 flagellar biosynthesis regulator FlaF [Szabonella alba]